MKSVSAAAKPAGSSWCGKWPGAAEDLQLAAGHLVVGADAVAGGDDRVAVAPEDERRHGLGEVELVGRADALTGDVDHRAGGVHEGPPRADVLQRREARRHRGDVGADAQPDLLDPPPDLRARVDKRL